MIGLDIISYMNYTTRQPSENSSFTIVMTEEKKNTVLVKIGPSTIVGAKRGIFATEKLSPNQEVCFYDGYQKPEEKVTKTERDYLLRTEVDGVVSIGYMVPRFPGGVAQLANDAACLRFDDFPKEGTISQQVHFVMKASSDYAKTMASCNTMMIKDKLVTTRAVDAGEELFFYYGVNYWMDKAYYGTAPGTAPGTIGTSAGGAELFRALSIVSSFYQIMFDTAKEFVEQKLATLAAQQFSKIHLLHLHVETIIFTCMTHNIDRHLEEMQSRGDIKSLEEYTEAHLGSPSRNMFKFYIPPSKLSLSQFAQIAERCWSLKVEWPKLDSLVDPGKKDYSTLKS